MSGYSQAPKTQNANEKNNADIAWQGNKFGIFPSIMNGKSSNNAQNTQNANENNNAQNGRNAQNGQNVQTRARARNADNFEEKIDKIYSMLRSFNEIFQDFYTQKITLETLNFKLQERQQQSVKDFETGDYNDTEFKDFKNYIKEINDGLTKYLNGTIKIHDFKDIYDGRNFLIIRFIDKLRKLRTRNADIGSGVGGRPTTKGASANYTVVSCTSGETGGTYASKSGPAAAAKKAATRRFNGKSKLRLTLRQLGTQKQFTYDCQRVKLAKPVMRKIKGATVTSEYETKVKAVKH